MTKKGNHQYFTHVLEEKFPLLKNAGGYSICRTASGSQRSQVIGQEKVAIQCRTYIINPH